MQELPNDIEPQAAENNQPAGGQVQQHIIPIGNQIPISAQNIKTRVVECSYRVKSADTQRRQGRIILGEYDITESHAGSFKSQRQYQNGFHQTHHALKRIQIQRFFYQDTLSQPYFFTGQQNKSNANRGDAQASGLNQQRNHSSPKNTEMVGGIHNRQPGYANGAGCSK